MFGLSQERTLQGVLAISLLAAVGGIAYAVSCGTAIGDLVAAALGAAP